MARSRVFFVWHFGCYLWDMVPIKDEENENLLNLMKIHYQNRKNKKNYLLAFTAVVLFLLYFQSLCNDQKIFSMTGVTRGFEKEDWAGFFLVTIVFVVWAALGFFIYYLFRKSKAPPPDYAEFLDLQEDNEEERLWKN
ncbi:hypothetical protein A7Q09_06170 [Methylacidiphilum sp. Yel]|jgi:hypothetical protein|uniref:hypothetical protein n=1 Tax=Methylacidiphilum sp. Yel TaxID=1847730 RepID=UPI00110543DA|nr:hypothetical protein [Methylacidiphilum sp. Yel]TFE69072.1 hypothetical protein A7Q09_06170 [Methylacidiphilum sp. Yel]